MLLRTLLASWMLICKFGKIVDIFVDDDVQIVCSLVRRNIGGRETFRHLEVKGGCGRSERNDMVQEGDAVTRQRRIEGKVDL